MRTNKEIPIAKAVICIIVIVGLIGISWWSYWQTYEATLLFASDKLGAHSLALVIQFLQTPIDFLYKRMDNKTAKRNLAIAFWLCYFLDAFSNLVAWDMNPKVSAFTKSQYFGGLFFIMGFVINVLVPLTEELIPLVIGAFIGYFKEAFTGKEYDIADIEAWNLPSFIDKDSFKFKKPSGFRPPERPQQKEPSQQTQPQRPPQKPSPQQKPPTQPQKPMPPKFIKPPKRVISDDEIDDEIGDKIVKAPQNDAIQSFLDDDWSALNEKQIMERMNANLNRINPSDFQN